MKKKIVITLSTTLLLLIPIQLSAQLSLPVIFSDNMVLQQKTNAPVWGSAAPKSRVTIVSSWDGKEYTTLTDTLGKWKTTITTPSAGGPFNITITAQESITLNNVMIGEVWICSGQSNMEMPLSGWGKVNDYEKEIATANYPDIRLLQVEKRTSHYPMDEVLVSADGWQECSPATIPNFSSTAYFFGRDLWHNSRVPIGLIHASWGGTLAEAWTSRESLMMMPEFRKRAEEFAKLPEENDKQNDYFLKKNEEWLSLVDSMDFGIQNCEAIAAKVAYSDEDWMSVTLPGPWEINGLPEFDGFVWYRKSIDIPEQWEGSDLRLSLGTISDNDVTWFNGEIIGTTEGSSVKRMYMIPADKVRKGAATIAVRVLDTGRLGGFTGKEDDIFIVPVNKEALRKNLNEEWKFKASINLIDVEPQPERDINSPNNPMTLYNAMISPLVPYAIKGVIWYQGESNAGRAYQYRTLFPLIIHDWRTKWGYDFPFYFVQLSNYMQTKMDPEPSAWAELRDAQLHTLRLQKTGMAVTIDIGDAKDIHPKNKQEVGKRLALLARHYTYGEEVIAEGPMYSTHIIENNSIRICFKPSSSKLSIKEGNTLHGFSIAGPDKIFHWAEAIIEGNNVIVHSPKVLFPIAVRYAWADNPNCNLINEAGLPASPFRTDDWPGVTITFNY